MDTLTNWGESLSSIYKILSEDNYTILPLSITVIPIEGFVIKTYRKSDHKKAFINVFHHDSVKDIDMMLCHDPYDSNNKQYTATNRNINNTYHTNKYYNSNSGEDCIDESAEMICPVVYIGNYLTRFDKQGIEATVFNVLVSSSYFNTKDLKHNQSVVRITDNLSVNKVRSMISEQDMFSILY